MRSDVNIIINRDKCYVCGICIERCIMDNLRMYLSPCRAACPIHMNCQGYIRLLAQGKEEEAAREVRKDIPFAGIVGRVCTRPCEDKCERKKVDKEAVHIRALKRYLADTKPKIVYEPAPIIKESGKKVAIVGSGPAGLMAAHELATKGHIVTIFESATEPGGMLRWAIPPFRLPAEEISHIIELLEKMKVFFQTGLSLGKDFDLEKLEREWDAVLLAIGAGCPIPLNIPGESLPGVYKGLDFLRNIREGRKLNVGKNVIVIGGGNTAVDVALACRKLGADEVKIICLEKREDMPAFITEIEEALDEGITIKNCWGPCEIQKDRKGKLLLKISPCLRVFDEYGKFSPLLDQSSVFSAVESAETIFIAIGQKVDYSGLPFDLQEQAKSKIMVDPLTLQTKRHKVFAAGDLVTGSRSVIEAMAQGKEAAISIDRFLNGETLRWGRAFWDGICITDFPIDRSGAILRARAKIPRIPVPKRDLWSEVEKTLEMKEAREEAERCLNCGRPGELNQTCWYCLPCEIECPANALEVRLPYLVR